MSSVRGGDTPSLAAGRPPEQQQRGGRYRARYRRVREAARRRRALDLAWRITVLMVGIAIVSAGLVMLITPGPGWVAIIVGLAVLATEYVWAERLLARVKRVAERAAAKALDPRRRRRNQILLAIAVVVLIAVGWAYIARYGVTFPDWLTN
jgi:uncharacterized protein (TIGR02611 family)